MIDSTTMQQSLFANTVVLQNQTTDQSVVKINALPQHARAWRITLQRIDRVDRHAPLVPGDAFGSFPIVVGQQYSYSAGDQTTPVWPPLRSNPVLGPAVGGPRVCVQVAWGMGGANPARLAAEWPAMGGSIVVVGSYVEVFGGLGEVIGASADSFPVVTAHIVPAVGLPSHDSGELSISDDIRVGPLQDAIPPALCATWGGVAYVPDFARRVRVVLTQDDLALCGNTKSVPDDGDPTCVLTWFDDQGVALDSAMQGRFFPPAAGTALYTPPVWHPVPARATLLAVRGSVLFNGRAFVHWRIAP